MKKVIRVAILASALASSLAAEEALTSPADDFPNSVGVFGSVESQGGLSYQSWMGPWGVALTLGGTLTPYSSSSGSFYNSPIMMTPTATTDFYAWGYNAEIDLMYKLYSSNFWRWLSGDLFVYVKAAHRGGVTANYIYTPNADKTLPGTTTYSPSAFQPVFAGGIGVGYDITVFQHFAIPLLFGYTFEYPLRLNFDFGGGLRYRY